MSPAPDEGLRDLFAAVAAWTAQDGDTDYNREWMARAYAAVTAGGAVDPLAHPAPPPEPAPEANAGELRALVRAVKRDASTVTPDGEDFVEGETECYSVPRSTLNALFDAALAREQDGGA